MVIAVAGRRIDAPDAKEARFPLANLSQVRARVREFLKQQGARAVVCAAACGVDLIALTEAGELGLRRRIVLPFDRRHFRESSVVDRPGDWGPIYDRILDEVEARHDLVILQPVPEDQAYAAANLGILDEAEGVAGELHVATGALLVWDGKSRGADDITAGFGTEARKRGLAIGEILTL